MPKTELGKRLARWQLSHTAPAPLSIEHPVQADLAAAADEIERLSAALAEQDDFILKFTDPNRNGDWACGQCKPHSDMIKDGFVCGYHRATARAKELSNAQ